jgi:hypothetical protein
MMSAVPCAVLVHSGGRKHFLALSRAARRGQCDQLVSRRTLEGRTDNES